MFSLKAQSLAMVSALLLFSSAQAAGFGLKAICSVSQLDSNGAPSKHLVDQKVIDLEIGTNEQQAQSIATIEGLELKIYSPLTAAVPVIFVEGKSSLQTVQAGREISHPQSNVIFLNMMNPSTQPLSVFCNISLQERN